MRCRDALHCSLQPLLWVVGAVLSVCGDTSRGLQGQGVQHNTGRDGTWSCTQEMGSKSCGVKTVHLVKCFLLYNAVMSGCPLHAGVKPPVCAGQSIRTRSAHGEGTFVREGCMNAQLRWRIVDSRMCGPRHLSIRLESGPAPGSTHRNGRTPRHPTHHYSSRQCFLLPVQFSIF